jgi:hypothetical protein
MGWEGVGGDGLEWSENPVDFTSVHLITTKTQDIATACAGKINSPKILHQCT